VTTTRTRTLVLIGQLLAEHRGRQTIADKDRAAARRLLDEVLAPAGLAVLPVTAPLLDPGLGDYVDTCERGPGLRVVEESR
jgi:hypothetical protein